MTSQLKIHPGAARWPLPRNRAVFMDLSTKRGGLLMPVWGFAREMKENA